MQVELILLAVPKSSNAPSMSRDIRW
jgi:hypothetical protein